MFRLSTQTSFRIHRSLERTLTFGRMCSRDPLSRYLSVVPEVDSRPRLLQSTADSTLVEDTWSQRQMGLMGLGGGTATTGFFMILSSHADAIFTHDNIGISMICLGGALATYGSGKLKASQTLLSNGKPTFQFELLNSKNKFLPEKESLAKICRADMAIWPDEIRNTLADQRKNDQKQFAKEVAKRLDTLKERVSSGTASTEKGALAALTPKAFVINYVDPERGGSGRWRGDDIRSRAERFGEEVSLLLSVATPHDIVIVNVDSPGGAVSEFGLAASHMLRLKSAGIRTIATVDKVAASGGFLMACCADQIVAAPFAFLGSIGVIAELPNVNKILKKQDVDWLLFTAGKFKRTVTVFGENSDEGKQKFQNDLDSIHGAFKDHVQLNRGDRLDIEKVSTGEAWLAVQCKEFGLVDRIGTSWDVISDLANDGHDVLIVKRRKSNSSRLQRLLERAEDATLGATSILSGIRSHFHALLSPANSPPVLPDVTAKMGRNSVASSAQVSH